MHTQDGTYFPFPCTISAVILTFDRQDTISDLPKRAVYIRKVSSVSYFFQIIEHFRCFLIIINCTAIQNSFWNKIQQSYFCISYSAKKQSEVQCTLEVRRYLTDYEIVIIRASASSFWYTVNGRYMHFNVACIICDLQSYTRVVKASIIKKNKENSKIKCYITYSAQ